MKAKRPSTAPARQSIITLEDDGSAVSWRSQFYQGRRWTRSASSSSARFPAVNAALRIAADRAQQGRARHPLPKAKAAGQSGRNPFNQAATHTRKTTYHAQN